MVERICFWMGVVEDVADVLFDEWEDELALYIN